MKSNKKFWYCIIGGTTNELPVGSDAPLRQSVKNAYEGLTNEDEYDCSSGWGVTEDMKNLIGKIQNMQLLKPDMYEKLRKEIMDIKYGR